MNSRVPLGFVLLCVPLGCSAETPTGAADVSTELADVSTGDADAGPATSGSLNVLTYNVAGLLEGLSKSDPEANHPQISPKLNAYDLVLAQEDFCYHPLLAANVSLPHQSPPEYDPGCAAIDAFGDGLNRFSATPFDAFERGDWETCHGDASSCASDCLTNKGFSFARHTLVSGVELDVYNFHLEAGSCPEDLVAKQAQVDQLIALVSARSGDRAILIGGDSNLHWDRPSHAPIYNALLAGLGAEDSCRMVVCGDEDRIDRFIVRSSQELQLTVEQWWIPEEFVDSAGEDLSDHVPVAIRLAWQATR